MTTKDCPPRLPVVAAILGNGQPCGTVAAAARLGGRMPDAAEATAAASATPTERALARVLLGEQDPGDGPPSGPVMAELLLLAGDVPEASQLASALSSALLQPEDCAPVMERQKCKSAFAALYRRLALHQLNSQVRNKAAATLGRLSRP